MGSSQRKIEDAEELDLKDARCGPSTQQYFKKVLFGDPIYHEYTRYDDDVFLYFIVIAIASTFFFNFLRVIRKL